LIPWAEFWSPFGAQNKGLSPRTKAHLRAERADISPLALQPTLK
jgi:hypothetical protein